MDVLYDIKNCDKQDIDKHYDFYKYHVISLFSLQIKRKTQRNARRKSAQTTVKSFK